MDNIKTLWRAEGYYYEDGKCSIEMWPYRVVKRTPKGVWIVSDTYLYGKEKFVLLSGRKRYAYPRQEEALESLLMRKKRQVKIIEWQMKAANTIIDYIESKRYKLKERV